jgi:hypothetical protein
LLHADTLNQVVNATPPTRGCTIKGPEVGGKETSNEELMVVNKESVVLSLRTNDSVYEDGESMLGSMLNPGSSESCALRPGNRFRNDTSCVLKIFHSMKSGISNGQLSARVITAVHVIGSVDVSAVGEIVKSTLSSGMDDKSCDEFCGPQ